jgi:hypothetical protein
LAALVMMAKIWEVVKSKGTSKVMVWGLEVTWLLGSWTGVGWESVGDGEGVG